LLYPAFSVSRKPALLKQVRLSSLTAIRVRMRLRIQAKDVGIRTLEHPDGTVEDFVVDSRGAKIEIEGGAEKSHLTTLLFIYIINKVIGCEVVDGSRSSGKGAGACRH
jgi:hypothetical protein